jgi:hypothetical protein
MEDWIITYSYRGMTEDNTFTASGVLHAIQQLAETDIAISDIIKIELEELGI